MNVSARPCHCEGVPSQAQDKPLPEAIPSPIVSLRAALWRSNPPIRGDCFVPRSDTHQGCHCEGVLARCHCEERSSRRSNPQLRGDCFPSTALRQAQGSAQGRLCLAVTRIKAVIARVFLPGVIARSALRDEAIPSYEETASYLAVTRIKYEETASCLAVTPTNIEGMNEERNHHRERLT